MPFYHSSFRTVVSLPLVWDTPEADSLPLPVPIAHYPDPDLIAFIFGLCVDAYVHAFYME